MTNSYMRGFCKKAQQMGVDPRVLIKSAAGVEPISRLAATLFKNTIPAIVRGGGARARALQVDPKKLNWFTKLFTSEYLNKNKLRGIVKNKTPGTFNNKLFNKKMRSEEGIEQLRKLDPNNEAIMTYIDPIKASLGLGAGAAATGAGIYGGYKLFSDDEPDYSQYAPWLRPDWLYNR